MPAMANITVNDGKATPVAHVFTPRSVDKGLAVWKENGVTPLDSWVLTHSLKEPSSREQPYRARVSITVPHTALNANGVKEIGYKELGAVEFTTSQQCTEAEAKDIRMLIANALTNAVLGAALDKREPFFGA